MKRVPIIVLLTLPSVAHANVVWPALYLETRLFSWWAISIGLFIEFLFLRWVFGLTNKQAALADLSANTASAIAGIPLVPIGGIAWELFPASVYNWLLGWGTFNPITWVGTFLWACVINALIEGAIYRRWFVPAFRFRSKMFLWVIFANAFSVGAALASLWIKPVQL